MCMREKVEDVLGEILFDMWHIDMRENIGLREEKLLGNRINMEARDLVVLLNAIEEKMDIQLDTKSLIDGKFDTFEHIIELMCNALQ